MTDSLNNTLSFDFSELTAFRKRLEKLPYDKVSAFIRLEVTRLVRQSLATAKEATPVDTGILRNGWRGLPAQMTGRGEAVGKVFNATEYAPYVEYGHRKRGGSGWVDAQPMLGRAEFELMYGGKHLPAKEQIRHDLDVFLSVF